MATRREIIMGQLPPEIAEKVIHNVETMDIWKGEADWLDREVEKKETAKHILVSGFFWSDSPEGLFYWDEIYNSLKY